MKNLKVFVTLFALLISTKGFSQEKPIEDDILVGGHLIFNPATVYRLQGEMEVQKTDLSKETVPFAVKMRPNGEIFAVSLGGDVLLTPQDDPEHYLPYPLEGKVTKIWLTMDGYDKNGEHVSGGWASVYNPEPGTMIVVTMYLGNTYTTMSIPLGNNIPKEDTVMQINGWGYYQYDPIADGYVVWYDDTFSGQTYDILYNGAVVASGIIDPLTNEPVPTDVDNFSLRQKFPSNVELVDFSMDTYYQPVMYSGLTLNGATSIVDGSKKESKTFAIVRNEMQTDAGWGLGIELKGLERAKFSVFVKDQDGHLICLLNQAEMSKSYGAIRMTVSPVGYVNFMIVITDAEYEFFGSDTFSVLLGAGKG